MPMKNAKKEAQQESKCNQLFKFLLCNKQFQFVCSPICCQLVRFTEIERENRILLEKMSNIMQKPQNISNVQPNRKLFSLIILILLLKNSKLR